MQILFLAHRIPYPPDKGERIRAFHELRYLGSRHEVDLFCFADSDKAAEDQDYLRRYCRRIHVEVLRQPARILRAGMNFVSGQPVSFGFFASPAFRRKTREAMGNCAYDVIFVYSSAMGQFIPQPAPVPVVVDFVDADSQKFTQYAASSGVVGRLFCTREARSVAGAERMLGRQAKSSFAVTEHDARDLGGPQGKDFKVEVIPNGVQVPESSGVDEPTLSGVRPYLLFVGTMNYPPNADAVIYFARTILPLVRKSYPGMKFVIVGRDPDRRVRELAEIPGVLVTGTVADPFPYFRNAELSVAPFRISQGFHNKIAESLAVGTPVVTSSRAKAGIGLSEREGLFVADSPEEFVKQVEAALDPEFRRKIRENAATVRQMLSWDARLEKMEALIVQASAAADMPAFVSALEH